MRIGRKIPWSRRLGGIGESAIKSRLKYFCSPMKPDPEYDVGIDFFCELIENGSPSLKYFLVQAKGTQYFDNRWGRSIDKETVQLWLNAPFPVYVIVYDDTDKNCYWMSIEEQRTKIEEKMRYGDTKTVYLTIDKTRMLRQDKNADFVQRIREDLKSLSSRLSLVRETAQSQKVQSLGETATQVYYAIEGKKRKTKSGVYVCPSCGYEHWSVSVEKDGSAKCTKCGKVMASRQKDIDRLLVEKEVDSYICSICGSVVEDTPLNYTGDDTVDGKMAILCPKLHNFVNGLPLLHHGSSFGDFEIKMSGTDYFFAYHKPCRDKQNGSGFCDIYAGLIDNTGRVIFNLQCLDCKAVDAVKTTVIFRGKGIERIFLSPRLGSRIGKHPWDSL